MIYPAPIILFVYNRLWHTEQTLHALKQNELAEQSVLYIFSDGPKDHPGDREKVEAVRKFIGSQHWCKEVHIIASGTNKGLAQSVIDGVGKIIDQYGKAIVLEDDIVSSGQFLPFLNGALNAYEQNDNVFGVSGFAYPGHKAITRTHFLPIACSWGWGTWKNRWDKVNFDAAILERKIEGAGEKHKFDFGGYPFFKMLQDQIAGKVNSWAIRFYASMFLQKACFVYPEKSLVKNIGFDEQGSHTKGPDNFFDKVVYDKINITYPQPLFDDNTKAVVSAFEQQFRFRISDKKKAGLLKKVFRKIKKIISA